MHPQTLRMYEARGLIEPQRSPKGTRLYSQEDVERLRRIQEMTTELGPQPRRRRARAGARAPARERARAAGAARGAQRADARRDGGRDGGASGGRSARSSCRSGTRRRSSGHGPLAGQVRRSRPDQSQADPSRAERRMQRLAPASCSSATSSATPRRRSSSTCRRSEGSRIVDLERFAPAGSTARPAIRPRARRGRPAARSSSMDSRGASHAFALQRRPCRSPSISQAATCRRGAERRRGDRPMQRVAQGRSALQRAP